MRMVRLLMLTTFAVCLPALAGCQLSPKIDRELHDDASGIVRGVVSGDPIQVAVSAGKLIGLVATVAGSAIAGSTITKRKYTRPWTGTDRRRQTNNSASPASNSSRASDRALAAPVIPPPALPMGVVAAEQRSAA